MTTSTFYILLFSAFLIFAITISLYRLTKKERTNNSIFAFLPLIISYFLIFTGSYRSLPAKLVREHYNIPKIEETMILWERTKFKEVWINNEKSDLLNSKKIIKISNTIDKEIDIFINYKDQMTLIEQSIFPLFSDSL